MFSILHSGRSLYRFGSLMQGRSCQSNRYRFGFNSQEKDDEVYGVTGSSYTAQFWQYDPRIGRRWNLDPKPQISINDYACFSNNPIWFNDPLGDIWGNSESEEKGKDLKANAKTKRNEYKAKAKKFKKLANQFKGTDTEKDFLQKAEEANKGVASMQQLMDDIDAMGDENNPTEFFYVKITGGTGQTYMNENGQIIMEYGSKSNAAHESTHGGQHIRGEIEFLPGKLVKYYDLTDEQKGYKTQYFFGGNATIPFIKIKTSNDITIDIIKVQPQYIHIKDRTEPINKPIRKEKSTPRRHLIEIGKI